MPPPDCDEVTTSPEFSTCAPATADECYTPWLNDAFLSLPKAKRIDVIGTNGKGMYQFNAKCPGMIMSDGKGGFVFTDSPILDLPHLVGYVQESGGGFALNPDRTAIEGDPPDFGYIMVQRDDDGEWMKLRGKKGESGLLIWDGEEFGMTGMEEANVSVSRPDEECNEAEIVGFATPDCDEGEPNLLKRVASEDNGVFYFNTLTGKTKITPICEVFLEEAERSVSVPFIPACSSGKPIRFRGPADNTSMLYWDANSSEWVVMDLDTKACDPDCGCATYLVPIYDCATNTWQITEEPDHVLHWKVWSDAGVSTSINFTLPWPALVQVFALRRMTPNIGETSVVSADIAIDSCLVTSPSDGGLVGNLGEASTSTGMAIVPLSKGAHTAYVTNDTVIGGGTPQWDGAWLKVYAHKITGCDQINPPLGAGDIEDGTGGGGGGPAGPTGPAGGTGPMGAAGPPGPAGADGDENLYLVDTCPAGFSLIWQTVVDDPVPGTDTFYFKGVSATAPIVITAVGACELNWSIDECIPCYPDHYGPDPTVKQWHTFGVDGADALHHVEVTPDVPAAFPQIYLATQAADGELSYVNTEVGAPPGSGYNYYAISQDASGNIAWMSLSTVLDGMGYVSTSVVP